MTTHSREFEASLHYVQQQYGYSVTGRPVDGESNSVAVLSNGADSTQQQVLKVPNGSRRDNEYRALNFLQKELDGDQPWSLPRVVEKSDNPPFLLVSYIPGEVLEKRDALTIEERRLLGRDIARFAILETNFDTETFRTEVDKPRGGSWRNWDEWFNERLCRLTDKNNLPTLTKIAQEMITLRELHYPKPFAHYASQVIHGDLRLPNLALRYENGRRSLSGIFDFETMRLGDMAEEVRTLHLLGKEAIDACNQELDKQGYPTIAPEKIKLWCVGRWTASLLYQLANGRPDPDEYGEMVQYLTTEYPDNDWRELTSHPKP